MISLARIATVLTLFISSTSFADSIKFCFRTSADFEDNGFGEDYWENDHSNWARGARVKIDSVTGGVPTTQFQGNLGDGAGPTDTGDACTPTLTVATANQQYNFYLYSWDAAIDGGHEIDVSSDNYSSGLVLTLVRNHTQGAGTFSIEMFAATDEGKGVFRSLITAALALVRTGRWSNSDTLKIYLDLEETLSNYKRFDDLVTMSPNGAKRKFSIAHEVGHYSTHHYIGAGALGSDCSLNSGVCSNGDGHYFTSLEYRKCAFSEGLANFFAAATFNNPVGTGCSIHHGNAFGETYPCASGSGSSTYPDAYMENECDAAADRGVELDWMRTFWDVLYGTGGSMPDFGNWLSNAASWSFVFHLTHWQNPYEALDESSDDENGEFNTHWDIAKITNGIDW